MPPSAIDIMANARPVPFRQAATAILLAALVALSFGSKALVDWATDLPINRASDAVLNVATAWQATMERVGLSTVAAELRAGFRKVEEWGREVR